MVSTFGSVAASPLPRVTLLMAAFTLDEAGKLTGPTAATPGDEAAKALPSFGNPATAIIPYRRLGGQRSYRQATCEAWGW